jgi:hypothetical protein
MKSIRTRPDLVTFEAQSSVHGLGSQSSQPHVPRTRSHYPGSLEGWGGFGKVFGEFGLCFCGFVFGGVAGQLLVFLVGPARSSVAGKRPEDELGNGPTLGGDSGGRSVFCFSRQRQAWMAMIPICAHYAPISVQRWDCVQCIAVVQHSFLESPHILETRDVHTHKYSYLRLVTHFKIVYGGSGPENGHETALDLVCGDIFGSVLHH